MRAEHRRGMGWLTAAVVALVMVATFVLAGGLGLSQGAAPLAVKQSYANGDMASAVSVTIANSCASSPTISGRINLSKKASGTIQLGLFFLGQDPAHQFVDTGRRAIGTFNNANSASYAFTPFTPVFNSPAYLVRVLNASRNIYVPSYFTQSLAIPVCQPGPTQTVTATSTTTELGTTTTATQTNTVTQTATTTTTAPGTTTTDTTTTTSTAPGTTTTETTTSTTSVVSTELSTVTATEHDTTTATVTYSVTITSPTTTTETATQTVTSTVLSPTTHTVTTSTTTTTSRSMTTNTFTFTSTSTLHSFTVF